MHLLVRHRPLRPLHLVQIHRVLHPPVVDGYLHTCKLSEMPLPATLKTPPHPCSRKLDLPTTYLIANQRQVQAATPIQLRLGIHQLHQLHQCRRRWQEGILGRALCQIGARSRVQRRQGSLASSAVDRGEVVTRIDCLVLNLQVLAMEDQRRRRTRVLRVCLRRGVYLLHLRVGRRGVQSCEWNCWYVKWRMIDKSYGLLACDCLSVGAMESGYLVYIYGGDAAIWNVIPSLKTERVESSS